MDVSHAAVQAAQRKVGDQLEAERLERIRLRDQVKRYGPHDEDTAPTTVKVRGAAKFPEEEERPVPESVLVQRRRINTIAHSPTPPATPVPIDTRAANTELIARLRQGPNATTEPSTRSA